MADAWYPRAEVYYVDTPLDSAYPVRQGDVFETPEDAGSLAEWKGFMLVHPTCEIRKAALLQVARLHAVSELPEPFQQTLLTYGYKDLGDGNVQVAYANTFWLPPASETGTLAEPMFVDFREVAMVGPERVEKALRARTMSHDARLYLIRRKILFRYRWNLPLEQIKALEAHRIGRDATFEGPRPDWASQESSGGSTTAGIMMPLPR